MRSAGVWKILVSEWSGAGKLYLRSGKSGRHSTFRPSSFAASMATNVFSPLTLSLTPCFSWVVNDVPEGPNRFSGFFAVNDQTAKAVVLADSPRHLAEARC